MRILPHIILGFITLFSGSIQAQDTINLLNGKVIYVEVLNSDSTVITYNYTKGKKVKTKSISTELIFTVQYAKGYTDTLYFINPENDLHLTVPEMQLFIYGEQDAKAHFKAPVTAILGLAFGTTFGYLLRDGFYVAAVPLVYTVGAGISPVNVKSRGNRSPETMSTQAYQEGYIKVARSKKAFNALASSVVGTLTGILIGNATN
jgi:hypothetical protein